MKGNNGWIVPLDLPRPSLADNTADADRLVEALGKRLQADTVLVDYDLLLKLPGQLREQDYRCDAVAFKDRNAWHLVGIADPAAEVSSAGLAVDLGTSRIVMRLVDLKEKKVLAETHFDNPQIDIGPDVLTRIHHADTPEGSRQLKNRLIAAINDHTGRLCDRAGVLRQNIHLTAVAGNTAMTHLFLGLCPRWIVREPYIPVVNRPGMLRAARLGLDINPSAAVFIFPNIGSYFGGDLLAGILSTGIHRGTDPVMLLDVGTNAEVVLGNRDWLIACAGAAGPALEGGVTRMGMMAGPGAIDRISVDPQSLDIRWHTIDEQPPVGICGSGIIDLAAHLFLAGMLDISGKLVPPPDGRHVKMIDDMAHLVVVPAARSATGKDLTVSQADFDSLIRAKAAMFTILETLTRTVGVSLEELETLHVAGTFGMYIDPESAIAIGMLPDLDRGRFSAVGNTSLEGATRLLFSRDSVDEIDHIRTRLTYLELNVNQEFMNRFSAARFLPHTDLSRFPSLAGKLQDFRNLRTG